MDEKGEKMLMKQEPEVNIRRFSLIAALVSLIPVVITFISEFSNIRDRVVSIIRPIQVDSTAVIDEQKEDEDISRLAVSSVIRELTNIQTTYHLSQKLSEYIKAGRIVVGNKDDFKSIDECYVFIVDVENVLDVLQFKDNIYYGVKSKEKYSQIPDRFKGKKSIWVIEAELVNPLLHPPTRTYVKTRILLTDGGNSLIRQSIQTTLTTVIQEINRTTVGVGNLDGIRQYCTDGGFLSILELVATDRIYSIMLEVRTKLIDVLPSSYFEVRGIKVNLGNRSNKGDFEYLVFTLNREGLIVDLNYALKEHQYEDIIEFGRKVNDDLARRQILKFLETYRTAYNKRNLPFLEKVFSDHALILVGLVVRESKPNSDFLTDRSILGPDKVRFIRRSKREYLDALRVNVFSKNSWIDVKFSEIEVIQHDSIPTIYGVNIKQEWTSQYYSDTGYLFLMFDFQNVERPIIHVRVWQPRQFDDGSVIGLYDFEFARRTP